MGNGPGASIPAFRALLAALLSLGFPLDASAQTGPGGGLGGFSLMAFGGLEVAGPAWALETAFEDAGFGDATEGGCIFFGTICSGGVTHPKSTRQDRPEYGAEVRYRFHPTWSVAVSGGVGAKGYTGGYDAETQRSSDVGYSTRWTALIFSVDRGLRMGAGPAYEWTAWEVGGPGSSGGVRRSSTAKPGFVAELALPAWTRGPFSVLVVARYRQISSTAVADEAGNALDVHSRTFFLGAGLQLR